MSDAFAILPREMWDNIGTFLDDDDDWENFTNSCQALYDLFKGQRTQRLFGKVLRALTKTPNEIHPYIKMDHLLNWRSVCSWWNKPITDYMAADPWHYDFTCSSTIYMEEFSFTTSRNNEEEKHYSSWMDDRLFFISDTTEVQKKYELMLNSHPLPKNPILSRSVYYDDTDAEDLAQHVQVGLQLLDSYGAHVLSICFYFGRTYAEMSFYTQMFAFLHMIPNIKYLFIAFGDANIPSNPAEMAELITNVGAIPLMRLDHLITFISEGLPYPIFNEILRANPHIQQLKIGDQVASPEIENYCLCPLENLKKLIVTIRSADYMTLLESSPGRWPLQVLKLHMKIQGCQSSCYGLARMSRMIEARVYQSTLTDLELQLPNAVGWRVQLLEESLNDRLQMPCVKKLQLYGASPYSLDFILPMADSLQHLVIAFPALDNVAYLGNVLTERPLKEEVIQFLDGYGSHMEDSNIWGLFPNLKGLRALKLKGMPAVDPFGSDLPTTLFVEPYKYVRKNGTVHKRILTPYTVDWD